MTKIKNIEFLRTFLIIAIVFHHMFINRSWCLCQIVPNNAFYAFMKSHIAFSYNAVEGFFIIAGFLLVWTFKNSLSVKNFIIKKYIRLSPVIISSLIICLIGTILGAFHFNIIANLLTALLLNQFVADIAIGQNPILWFTSVLFAALLIYFCILKFAPKDFQKPLITFLFIMSYALLEILQHGGFNKPLKNYDFILNIGFLRGMGGIGLGCLIGEFFKSRQDKFNSFEPPAAQEIMLTVLEAVTLGVVVWWLCFPHIKYNNILFVFWFTILFGLFIIKKGYISKLLDKDIWVFLGKYQYSMYVVHYVIIKIFGIVLWQKNLVWVLYHPVLPVIIMLLTIMTVTAFSYHCVEKPCAEYLKEKFIK